MTLAPVLLLHQSHDAMIFPSNPFALPSSSPLFWAFGSPVGCSHIAVALFAECGCWFPTITMGVLLLFAQLGFLGHWLQRLHYLALVASSVPSLCLIGCRCTEFCFCSPTSKSRPLNVHCPPLLLIFAIKLLFNPICPGGVGSPYLVFLMLLVFRPEAFVPSNLFSGGQPPHSRVNGVSVAV